MKDRYIFLFIAMVCQLYGLAVPAAIPYVLIIAVPAWLMWFYLFMTEEKELLYNTFKRWGIIR